MITAEGQSDSNIRRIFTTGWQSQWQAALESQLLAVSPKARLISVDYGKDPKNYQAAPIKMTFRYEIPGYALSGEREMLFKPMVMNNLYNQVKVTCASTPTSKNVGMVSRMPAHVWSN